MRCFSLLLALVSVTGCLPALSTMQRTTTLPPGKTSISLAAGTVVGSFVPSADFAARVGVADRVDVGLRVGTLSAPVVVDAKFQLVRSELFELAFAPGVGTSLMSPDLPLHVYAPVLAGLRFADDHRVIVGAKYVWMSSVWDSAAGHAPGAVVGLDLALNERARLMPMLDAQCFSNLKSLCLVTASMGVLF